MKKVNQPAVDNRSKSQMKRETRQQELAKAKRTARKNKLIGRAIIAIIVAIILVSIGLTIYGNLTTTAASSNYSAQLTNEGLIKDVAVSDYVTPIDYNNITIPLADVEYPDSSVDADIQTTLENSKILNKEASRIAADGDTINLDYVGSIDGVEFDGGSTNGAGSDLTLGSGTFIDDFEEQLIGTKPGDTLSVEVTFPSDYATETLAGKDAVFAVTINGVYDLPTFDDAFVLANLSEYADTAEGYREYLKQSNYDSNLYTYLDNVITTESTVSTFPNAYIKFAKSVQKYNDTLTYESTNEMYSSYLGYNMYNNFSEYTGQTNTEYEASLQTSAESRFTTDCAYQLIFTEAGLTISDEEYTAYTSNLGEGAESTYGKGYIMQLIMHDKVLDYLSTIVTVS